MMKVCGVHAVDSILHYGCHRCRTIWAAQIRAHLRTLSPHVKQRTTAALLALAIEVIESQQMEIDELRSQEPQS